MNEDCRHPRPLQELPLSIPAKIAHNRRVIAASGPFAHLIGGALHDALTASFEAPVLLENDADTALTGELVNDAGVGRSDVGMFVVSTALASSIALDRTIRRGRRRILGDFGALPFGEGRTLNDVVSAGGIIEAAGKSGRVRPSTTCSPQRRTPLSNEFIATSLRDCPLR